MLRLTYGAPDAVAQAGAWLKTIRDAAYRASIALAAEKGAFPLYDADAYLAGEHISELPDAIRAGVAQSGVRNALLTSIAPTGTISLFAGNVSSGVEPIFATSYERKVTQRDGSKTTEQVMDYAVAVYRRKFGARTRRCRIISSPPKICRLRPMSRCRRRRRNGSTARSLRRSTCPKTSLLRPSNPSTPTRMTSGCKGCTHLPPQ